MIGMPWRGTGRSPIDWSLVAVLLVIVTACGSPGPTPGIPSGPTPPPGTLAPAVLEESVRFRTVFGLRADEDWVRTVAADPTSAEGTSTFGVPLLPAEVAELLDRAAHSPDVAPIIEQYGATVPDDWGGTFIDQQRGGVLVARFGANVDRHRRALAALLPAGARFEVRDSLWTYAELSTFIEQVLRDRDWFPTIGTDLFTAEIDVIENRVQVLFRGPDRAAAALIEAHFGAPPWLRAVYLGPLPWEGPRGDLRVVVFDRTGRPMPGVFVSYEAIDPAARFESPFANATGEDGTVLFEDLPAVAYRISIRLPRAEGEGWSELGERPAMIPPKGVATVRFDVDLPSQR